MFNFDVSKVVDALLKSKTFMSIFAIVVLAALYITFRNGPIIWTHIFNGEFSKIVQNPSAVPESDKVNSEPSLDPKDNSSINQNVTSVSPDCSRIKSKQILALRASLTNWIKTSEKDERLSVDELIKNWRRHDWRQKDTKSNIFKKDFNHQAGATLSYISGISRLKSKFKDLNYNGQLYFLYYYTYAYMIAEDVFENEKYHKEALWGVHELQHIITYNRNEVRSYMESAGYDHDIPLLIAQVYATEYLRTRSEESYLAAKNSLLQNGEKTILQFFRTTQDSFEYDYHLKEIIERMRAESAHQR